MELVKYDAACSAIAEARSVDELKGIHDASKAMAAAARIAKNRGAEADMMEIRFRAERRIGELMAMQKAAGCMAKPPGNNQHRVAEKPEAPTLSEVGIDKNLADRARKYARIDEPEFNERVDEYRNAVVDEGEKAKADLLAMGEKRAHVVNNSGNNEWYTPEHIIEAARVVLGGFDLDPAASEQSNTIVKADKIFTVADDGLKSDWPVGRVWMNPPYSHPQIEQFCERFVLHIKENSKSSGIVLVNNATETKWCQALLRIADMVCFLKSRTRFWNAETSNTGAPLQGQIIVGCNVDLKKFEAEFSPLGVVLKA